MSSNNNSEDVRMEQALKNEPDKEPDSNGLNCSQQYAKDQVYNPLSGISRTITDEELKESAGARKLLLYAYDKLETENKGLHAVADKYHKSEIELARSQVKLQYLNHIFSIGDLSKMIGGVLLGFAINHFAQLLWIAIGGLALLLMVGPFVCKLFATRNEEEV